MFEMRHSTLSSLTTGVDVDGPTQYVASCRTDWLMGLARRNRGVVPVRHQFVHLFQSGTPPAFPLTVWNNAKSNPTTYVDTMGCNQWKITIAFHGTVTGTAPSAVLAINSTVLFDSGDSGVRTGRMVATMTNAPGINETFCARGCVYSNQEPYPTVDQQQQAYLGSPVGFIVTVANLDAWTNFVGRVYVEFEGWAADDDYRTCVTVTEGLSSSGAVSASARAFTNTTATAEDAAAVGNGALTECACAEIVAFDAETPHASVDFLGASTI
jgi:hypothetical protein